MNFNIKNEELESLNESENAVFPKHTSQLINWANQNAQGTRPKVVGQLSDLFPEYQEQSENVTVEDWKEWYLERYPNAIENATAKIYTQVQNLKEAIQLIDRDMVQRWVEDLVITKTYNGMYVQKAILAKLARTSFDLVVSTAFTALYKLGVMRRCLSSAGTSSSSILL